MRSATISDIHEVEAGWEVEYFENNCLVNRQLFTSLDTAMYSVSEWLEGHDTFALSEEQARERLDSDNPAGES